jgi:hypothetical protein
VATNGGATKNGEKAEADSTATVTVVSKPIGESKVKFTFTFYGLKNLINEFSRSVNWRKFRVEVNRQKGNLKPRSRLPNHLFGFL